MPTSPTYKFVPLLCALAMATVSPGGLTPARAQPAPIVGSPGGLTPARAQPATIVGQPAANPAANFSANAPQLQFPDRLLQSTLGRAYDGALDNLLRINTVSDVQNKFDPTGRMAAPRQFIRAGGGYDTPWTRDASLNSWNAASLLEPVVARNTLWAVCQQQPDGSLVLQRDNQWWDKVIWITAAWNHFKVTGDRQFLAAAYGVTKDELSLMRGEHFNEKYGLYQGPAFFADGIAGYPAPPYDPTNGSSFVLDHHYSAQLMTLSTNCVYYNAYRCAALMAAQLGAPSSEIRGYSAAAAALKTAINRHLWNAQNGTYAYFVHGAGPLAGQRDNTQEGIGLAYAILFGVADERQARRILQAFPRSPHGVTAQWPHFARFSDERPGRHNVVVWPNVSGMWACAAAQTGDVAMLRDEIENLALLALGDNARFHEIYNPLHRRARRRLAKRAALGRGARSNLVGDGLSADDLRRRVRPEFRAERTETRAQIARVVERRFAARSALSQHDFGRDASGRGHAHRARDAGRQHTKKRRYSGPSERAPRRRRADETIEVGVDEAFKSSAAISALTKRA